mmetsp:Transcript_5929/g.17726  ORF Transcript_5929/g.17726 Transcript_5929/m.17726 type:complete len:297 (+) Transcript_5929:619-1509(+)
MQLLRQVIDARLHVDQHLRHTLELSLIPVELFSRLRQVGLEVVNGLPSSDVPLTPKLELLNLQPQPPALLGEAVDGGLVLLGQVLEVPLRVLLGQELLDDLVGVAYAGRLLDGVKGLLVVQKLLPLLVRIVVGETRIVLGGKGQVLPLALALLVQLLLVLQHLFSLLQALVHLHTLLDEGLFLLHLLVTLVPLFHDALLKPVQLCLGHLLGVVGIMREQQQLLVVALLCLEGPLDGRELIVKAIALLFEAPDNSLVGLADALGLVVLDHCLVEAVLEDPDLPHLRRGLAGVHLRTD